MPNSLDGMGKKATNAIAILTLVGMIVGFLDIRHAKSEDFKKVADQLVLDRMERYEEKVEETENAIARLQAKHKLDEWEKLHLQQLRDRKARYLRKVNRQPR